MANGALIRYIKEGMQKGYSAASLRAYLLQHGYPQMDVDTAIREASGKGSASGKKFMIFLIVLLFIAAIAIGAVYKLMPGNNVPNNIRTNIQDQSEEIIDIKTDIEDLETEIQIPNNNQNKDTTKDNQIEDSIATEEIYLEESPQGSFENVRSINDCDTFKEAQRDECVLDFSWKKDHVGFCERIVSTGIKDECHSRYALKHEDKTGCDSIDNRYSREICVYLLLTTDKLKELNVEYVIDAKKQEILFDEELAMQRLESKVKRQQAQIEREQQKISESISETPQIEEITEEELNETNSEPDETTVENGSGIVV